jgi:nicotinic acid phosphoribosyltransferase
MSMGSYDRAMVERDNFEQQEFAVSEWPERQEQHTAVSEYDFTDEDWDWLDQQMIEKTEILQWLADH